MADRNNSKRVFATIVYPESAPADWLNILRDLHSPILVSPLHDRDLKKDHTPKKAHYHVMFLFEGKITEGERKAIIAAIGGVGEEILRSTRGYARYLCHLDEEQELKDGEEYKPRYDIERVIALGGAAYGQYLDKSLAKYSAIKEIMKWCRENEVSKVREVLDYASQNRADWFMVLCDGGIYVLREYLR